MKKWMFALFVTSIFIFTTYSCSHNDASGHAHGINKILSVIPSDTIYYLGGQGSEALSKLAISSGLSVTNIEVFQGVLDDDDAEASSATPSLKFFRYILTRYAEVNDGTTATLFDFFGIDKSAAYALYSHGAMPVARTFLADSATFEQLIHDAVKDSGWQYSTETIGTTEIKYWPLDDDLAVSLAMAVIDNELVVSLINRGDDINKKRERFGLSVPGNSLADSREVQKISEKYAYAPHMTGFVHLERIAAGMLDAEANRFGRDLVAFSGKPKQMMRGVSQNCREDFMSVVAKVPRIVGGYNNLESNSEAIKFAAKLVLEIADLSLIKEIASLRGHLPEHAHSSEDKMFGVALGLNTETLVPVLTNLWSRFVKADYTCDQFVTAQEAVKKANPAILGLMLGMVQGVKGMGVSVYDLVLGDSIGELKSVSAIVSVAAESPATVSKSLALIPTFPAVDIPADGKAVDVQIAGLQGFKVAIKGKHLVFYSGEGQEARLSAMESEALSINGLYSFAMNYRKLDAYFEDLFSGLSKQSGECVEARSMINSVRNLDLDAESYLDVTEHGITLSSSGTIDYIEPIVDVDAEKYHVSELTESCEWKASGIVELKRDGTGIYTSKSQRGDCSLNKWAYTYRQEGDQLIFDLDKDEHRETCADDFVQSEKSIKACHISYQSVNNFECVFQSQNEKGTVLRFAR